MIAFAKNSDIQKWFEAKNMPKSNSTQNDNETLDSKFSIPNDELYTKQELDKAVADARREVIKKVEKMKKNGWDLSKIDYGFIDQGYNQAIDDVLATLREEES